VEDTLRTAAPNQITQNKSTRIENIQTRIARTEIIQISVARRRTVWTRTAPRTTVQIKVVRCRTVRIEIALIGIALNTPITIRTYPHLHQARHQVMLPRRRVLLPHRWDMQPRHLDTQPRRSRLRNVDNEGIGTTRATPSLSLTGRTREEGATDLEGMIQAEKMTGETMVMRTKVLTPQASGGIKVGGTNSQRGETEMHLSFQAQ